MLRLDSGSDEHEKFKKLCALAASGNLSPLESVELQGHLRHCEPCNEVFRQYQALATEGMTILAVDYSERRGPASWDSNSVFEQLLERIRTIPDTFPETTSQPSAPSRVRSRVLTSSIAIMALAASILLAVAFGAYRLGLRANTATAPVVKLTSAPIDDGLQKVFQEKRLGEVMLAQQAKRLAQLQADGTEKEQELSKLKSALRTLEDRSTKLAAAGGQTEAQMVALSQQRDSLAAQLQAITQSFEKDKAELVNLRLEHERTSAQTSSLEAKISDLSAINRDQERRLKDTEQYLGADRDVRELMGARKLYIADVFDVDGSSRTQKPFGRVFYTQGKSLIFYAFDLDRQPGVVNASTFQVWGQREGPQGQQALPMNLGILYMDNESNRRWAMRFDDPKKLAEIDAVFVTVEPRGGSHKPTNKPFLYALLRNEANHP